MLSSNQNPIDRDAYGVHELARKGVFKKSHLYELINNGALPAKMAGSRRVVLAADWERFIANLPAAPVKRRAAV